MFGIGLCVQTNLYSVSFAINQSICMLWLVDSDVTWWERVHMLYLKQNSSMPCVVVSVGGVVYYCSALGVVITILVVKEQTALCMFCSWLALMSMSSHSLMTGMWRCSP